MKPEATMFNLSAKLIYSIHSFISFVCSTNDEETKHLLKQPVLSATLNPVLRTSRFLSLSDLVLSLCFSFLDSIEHKTAAVTCRSLHCVSKNRLARPIFVMYMLAGNKYESTQCHPVAATCHRVTEHGHVHALADCGVARCFSGAVRWRNHLYLIGGDRSAFVERYDLARTRKKEEEDEPTWTPVQPMPHPILSSASAVLHADKIYVVGCTVADYIDRRGVLFI